MTADEKETILVELFNAKKSKEIESKDLNNSIKGLRIKRSRVASQIAGMSQERREAYLSLIGKGKYAEIIMEPTRLKNELMSLERSATELYEGEPNLKAVKAYAGKGPVLKEDIKIAEEEAEKAEQEIADIISRYIDLVTTKRGINNYLRTQKKLLKVVSKELRIINKEIKRTDKKKTDEHVLRRTK